MANKRKTVRQLAREACIDIDETLVILWYGGFNKLTTASSFVGRRDVTPAKKLLGIATRRDLKKPSYWEQIFNIGHDDFLKILEGLGIVHSPKAQVLKPKAISRLRAEARKQGFDPSTGQKLKLKSKAVKKSVLNWSTIGHVREFDRLNIEQVRAVHFELVNDFSNSNDPIEPPGVKSEELLASAIFRAWTSLKGTLKYPTVEMAAAALLHSLILDHPFHNGNKRTALVSTLVFLDQNGFFPDFNQDEIFKLVLQIAQHIIVDSRYGELPDREVMFIAEWFYRHCRLSRKGNKLIPYRKLRAILTSYGCWFAPSSANKIIITRIIKKRRFFGDHRLTLNTQIPNYNDGQDVGKSTIKKIRKDLLLDDQNGIDFHAFYNKETIKVQDFIAYYRKTLDRLAKF